MSENPKSISKPPVKFSPWEEGEKHAPDSVRQKKRREKQKGKEKRQKLKEKMEGHVLNKVVDKVVEGLDTSGGTGESSNGKAASKKQKNQSKTNK